ncbi:MAG: SprT-like domain-containing protein [Candidatus Thiodiazotropha lotti]|uniref:SprT-like domain-containing protein n=1 Tax=Candidatus Thiodiazotropha lotti TaxID=2792787 RepID=A0A9E4K3Q5_9GAMM|nr:SprT-like domain-containing protein [Candidatus Thiodiazotropha lotti]MCG7921962.1 SprT-like domain-containing protein [Candidatus Thiodiazotropha lotti]MCG7931570.1 SprT-like domain-containing protein [Candidatus Thiodiazotropha lotti]MCG7938484.1 SprT-like domain-containing protein [Candidatus Thiodiazotropha lotti]MCG7986557.1 SprT-like domain-containing protein [Candidatus Thiodiazotropha lotti]
MTEQQAQTAARERTRQLLASAEQSFKLSPCHPEILFDLKGKSAGLLVIHPSGQMKIRYNSTLLAQYGEKFLEQTVPHEVAHLLARRLYGQSIKPHGSEWRSIMSYFNVPANRCHSFDTSQSAARSMRYFDYHCLCRQHKLSAIRHNRIISGVTYLCQTCGSSLILSESS